ncbi:Metalloendoproteinase 5-MMP [Spatholobus suberectus]|nr:Metalloendoproteinase 5-MMP [Spatholobus suberectus]
MKSYLSAFLLFLLLVDKSLSRAPPSLTKVIFKRHGKKALDKIRQAFSPPKPNAAQKQIKGLSRIKDYFSIYGYLQSSGPFDDYLDQQTIAAITTYQQYFNLQATGDLNYETFQQISLPRCGVPDMNFDYGFTDNVSWPKAGNPWLPKGKNITYGFVPASEIAASMAKVFRDSFTRWARATGDLNLTETTYDDADIKVGFYKFGDGVMAVECGFSIIRLQPASNVTTGEIRLDATKFWALPSENDSLSWQQGILDSEKFAISKLMATLNSGGAGTMGVEVGGGGGAS